MSLEELNAKVHRPEYKPEDVHGDIPFTPEAAAHQADLPHALGQDVSDWTKSAPSRTPEPAPVKATTLALDAGMARRKKLALIGGAAALLLLAGGVSLKLFVTPFSNDKVKVSISGPKDAESNKSITFKVVYENRNWKDIENATLIVNHPTIFRIESGTAWQTSEARAEIPLGTVKGGTRETVELRGSFHALQKQVGSFQAVLRFSPKGIQSRYDTSNDLTVAVGSSPVVLNLAAPLQAGNDQMLEYTIEYHNESGEHLDNMRLAIDYPAGFRFVSSEPAPSEGNNVWYVGSIPTSGTGQVKTRGVITGAQNDVKRVTARLGKLRGDGNFLAFGETEKATRIVASPILVKQTVNGLVDGSIRPGESLSYDVEYRNNGDIGLRDLILTVDLDTTYLDIGRLSLESGTYNQARKQIFIKASDDPQLTHLAPGETGRTRFSVPVRSDVLQIASGTKNIAIETVARVDSPDVPTPVGANKVIASNISRVRILSDMRLTVTAQYQESPILNTGPIPPRVGAETTYTIRARLESSLNDITEGRLVFLLPSNVRYRGTRPSETETLLWHERAGEVAWEVGTLAGGTGQYREVFFQIGVTPDMSLVGKDITLVNSSVFTGRDAFGGQQVQVEGREITNQLGETALQASDHSRVQP